MAVSRSGRTVVSVAIVIGLLIAAGVGIWAFFLQDNSPAPASIGDDTDPANGETIDVSTLDGTWSVDTSTGSFDDFTSTWAGYRIGENIAGIGTTTAVGRTPDVSGDMTIADSEVTTTTIEIEMSTLESDDTRRDNQLTDRGLETDSFPTASFTLTEPIAIDGARIDTTAKGDLTLHGVTKAVEVPLEASFENEVITVTGAADVTLTDYGIEAPTGLRILSIDPAGVFEFHLLFDKADQRR